jgi:hypothetical protein
MTTVADVSGFSSQWKCIITTSSESLEEWLNTDFVVIFYEKHDTSKVMASWWREDKNFTNRTSGWYPTANLRESYIYLMALLCSIAWGERLLQVFRGLDASSLYGSHFQNRF